ncbi:SDR family oxidoreductase [Chloroflexota bacterium]
MIRQGALRITLGRVAQGSDIARAVVFLASSESDYLTGLSISVAGGSQKD